MNKAAVLLASAALLTAIAAAVADAHSPASVRDGATTVRDKPCTPGKSGGEAVELKYKMTVAGDAVPRNGIGPGTWVTTDRHGSAEICLKQGHWTCRVKGSTKVQTMPPKERDILLYLGAGKLMCSTPAGGKKKLRTPRETLTLATRVASDREGESAHARSGAVFSLAVTKQQTVVKMVRGAAVVATANGENAVVVGRGEQTVVPAGQAPQPPTPIQLTPDEKSTLQAVASSLPKETDKTPPTARLAKGPADPAVSRTATFTFDASEDRVVFSCALDGGELRRCGRTETFPDLQPGRHSLLVSATDEAGNTGPTLPYSWTVARSTPIAFETNQDGNYEIYVVQPDGSGRTRLTNVAAALDVDPSWSPDGRELAFESDRDKQGPSEIYAMGADGSNPRRLTTNPANDRGPQWSPLGRQIVFESNRDGNSELYAMNADGSGQTRLTTDPARDADPAWAPDGRRLVFVSDRDGNPELYLMAPDGTAQTRITNDPGNDLVPTW
jgi:hypothetical protein